MKRKLLAALCVTAMSAGLLAGCGSSDKTEESTKTEETAKEETSSQEETETKAASSDSDNVASEEEAEKANDAGVSFKTCFIEAETTREEIHDYLEQYISEYKKTLVYASDVEALRKVYLGIKLFPDFQSLFPERLGLIGFDVTGWTKIAVPEISAIIIPAYQEGQIASRKLIEMIESKNSISNKKVIIKNAVRWRDSTL